METETTTTTLTLTEAAANKVRTLISAEGRDDLRLRIGVELGYYYVFYIFRFLPKNAQYSSFYGFYTII